MAVAGLHLHPLPQDAISAPALSSRRVFVILRIPSAYRLGAKVVAVHETEAAARRDLESFRLHEPNRTFAIFVPLDDGDSA